jgi:hypothetical protein
MPPVRPSFSIESSYSFKNAARLPSFVRASSRRALERL